MARKKRNAEETIRVFATALVAIVAATSAAATLPVAAETPAPHDVIVLTNRTGWQIFPGQGYRYGPSIIAHPDGSLDMWFAASCYDGAHWDQIRYRHSPDGGKTWDQPDDVIVLTPNDGSADSKSCCDPGAIRFGGYYYVGYTAVDNKEGQRNHVFLARARSARGPYEKWNGRGWGGDPKPFLEYAGPRDQWGCGEPSFVLSSGRLYVYYTWNDGGLYTDLAVCEDPTVRDWPAHMVRRGHVIRHEAPAEDSLDVKYVDQMNRFVAVATHNRVFNVNANVSVWQSDDGVGWTRVPFHGDRVQTGMHNIGISGNDSGHIDGRVPQLISYAYGWPGKDFTEQEFGWANWATFIDAVSIGSGPLGQPVVVDTSSTLNWEWSAPRAIDGNPKTAWSSEKHADTHHEEWIQVWLGAEYSVAGIDVTARPDGRCFARDFTLQSGDDGTSWTDIQCFTDYHAVGGKTSHFRFSAPVRAGLFRLKATALTPDENGDYYLQIAEIAVRHSGGLGRN